MEVVFIYDFLSLAILQQVISFVAASASQVTSKVDFDEIGPTSASLSWVTSTNSSLCDLRYLKVNGTHVELDSVKPNTGSGQFHYQCRLDDLQDATNYHLNIQCTNTSNSIVWQTTAYFRTLSNNTVRSTITTVEATTEVSTDTPTTTGATTTQTINTAAPPSAGTTLDIVLGALSALLGIILIGIVAFYLWRKYQRRRRIRQFFRHHQLAQPFPSEVNM